MWCSVPGMRTLQLAHRDEAVVPALLEVHVADGGAPLPGPAVLSGAGAFQQEIEDVPVVLRQPHARKTCGQPSGGFFDLVVLQPRVDDRKPLAQHGRHRHLGKVLPEAVRRVLLAVEVEDLPAEAGELIQQGLLDVAALVDAKRLLRHDGHSCGIPLTKRRLAPRLRSRDPPRSRRQRLRIRGVRLMGPVLLPSDGATSPVPSGHAGPPSDSQGSTVPEKSPPRSNRPAPRRCRSPLPTPSCAGLHESAHDRISTRQPRRCIRFTSA